MANDIPQHLCQEAPPAAEAREAELLRVNRALATLSSATEALIRASDEQQLLNEICRILVEVGGYAFAWVGYAQHDEDRSIWPVARFGQDNGYLAETRVSFAKGARAAGPFNVAIRSGQPQLTCVHDEAFAPWRDAALKRGFRAAVWLPLEVESVVIGVICVYSSDLFPSDGDELHLLDKLARNVAYGIGMQRMLFERRRAAQELKESEGRYRSLVELSPDAIVVHTQGIIIFSNSAADQLFRASPSAPLIGKRLSELMEGDGRPNRQHGHLDTDEGAEGVLEERLFRLDGTTFIAEVTAASIIFHGVRARQVVIRDITERKQVQDQLVQTAKLATLGEMAAGMAHELSQPINIIRMAAEGALLMIDRRKATPEYQHQQFGLIAGQAGRMAEIIDHIRIFSRKDTGAVAVFDAREALRLATQLLQPQLDADGIKLSLRLPNHPCPVLGRPVQLEQVIINLLTNAQDAIKAARGAASPVPAGQIRIEATTSQAGLAISVTDDGTGIGPSHLERVFEPFFTTKELGSGTGLGLSVSFGIISAMGGRLEAHNVQPRGAQFAISLPLTGEQPAVTASRAQPASIKPATASCRHILVVDDEQQAVDTMGSYLSEFGYRVSQAHSGNVAFRMFEADPADIVVTDVRMPDGDGEELVRRLRQISPALPIIVVTGHIGTTESLENAAGDGLTIVKKPISLAAMAKTIEHLLHNA